MKQESTFAYILRLSLTLFVIAGVIACLLAGVNAITEPRIAQAREERTRKALLAVLPNGDNLQKVPFTDGTGLVQELYQSDGGYAVLVAPNGFDGPVSMMVGVSRDGKVLGLSVISTTDTPGLGAVAGASSSKGQAFREQFIGQSGVLAVTKDGGSIDALTGATITSRGVTAGVNAALECVRTKEGAQ